MSAFLFRLSTSGPVSHLPDTLLAAFNRCGLRPDHRGHIYWALPWKPGWSDHTGRVYSMAMVFARHHPEADCREAGAYVAFGPLDTTAQIRDAFNAIPY